MTIKKTTSLLNWIGGLSAIWLLFLPKFYELSVLVNILIPIISILFAYKQDDKVGVDSRKWDNTSIPKIDTAILLPSFALIIRALIDIKIIGFKNIFIYSLIISIPLIVVLFCGTREYLKKAKIFSGVIFGMVFVFTFGCGTTILANTLLDQSEPEFYKAKIINKEIEKAKNTFYRIDIEPWGPILENGVIRVSKEEFDRLKVNDSIELELRNGFFKTQWIKIK